jgi:hypothetical protein
MFITAARHDREMAAVLAENNRLRKQRDDARKECDAFKAAAKTAARQLNEADGDVQKLAAAEATRRMALATVRGNRLIEGGYATPAAPSVLALRDRDLARGLADRLAHLTAINMRCTCGGKGPA